MPSIQGVWTPGLNIQNIEFAISTVVDDEVDEEELANAKADGSTHLQQGYGIGQNRTLAHTVIDRPL
jgi:hypothetical protein